MQSKLQNNETTIFTVMSKMAAEYNAINLSQGFPGFDIAPELVNLVNHYMQKGMNQYAPMPGLPALRQAIATKVGRSYEIEIDSNDQITVTTGATEGIFTSIASLVSPGDEVIYFDPAYDSYVPAVLLRGGIPVPIKLDYPGFAVPWDKVKKKISEKTRMIVINTPHNPSGTIMSKGDLDHLYGLVEGREIVVLSDEVYEHLVYDDEKHYSVLSHPELRKQSIAVFSFGKTFHATGWKMGYTVANEELTKEIRKLHQFVTFSVNTPIQYAITDYLKQPENYEELPVFFQAKRDLFLNLMQGSRFKPTHCSGTYFQTFSYASISNKDDVTMAQELTKEHKVAPIPFSAFYSDQSDHKLLRFCFAKKEEQLSKAAEILCRI